MSTVKITELPIVSVLDANTANTIFVGVDLDSGTTARFSATAIAHGLYSNNVLHVGNNYVELPNVLGQFTGNSTNYVQNSLQNLNANGSGDMVITADVGTDTEYYIDLGLNGSRYNFPGYTYGTSLDGYLLVQGNSSSGTVNGGNLIIATATTGKHIRFVQGGTTINDVVAEFNYNTGFKLTKKPLMFADVTSQNTAAAPWGYSNAAFAKANSALANTSGVTTAGVLNVGNNLNVNGTLTLANSNFTSTEAAMTIKATATVQTPSQDGYMLQLSGKQNIPTRVILDTYGSGSAYNLLAGRSARGTVVSPQATQNNDVLLRIAGNGWGTSGFAPLGTSRIDFIATENYTDSARGTKISFYNIPNGANTVQEIASFNADTVTFTGTVAPTKGFIYTPRVPAGAQTAITINFATDSMIKANLTADLAVTLTNFVSGKVVEMWLVNTGGTARTITHGCSATNSSENSATFTLPSTSSAYMRYFSIDGDLANTFVAVMHA